MEKYISKLIHYIRLVSWIIVMCWCLIYSYIYFTEWEITNGLTCFWFIFAIAQFFDNKEDKKENLRREEKREKFFEERKSESTKHKEDCYSNTKLNITISGIE